MSVPSPIADLSYRTYEGPLDSPNRRWWIIAKQTMRLGFKKKGFWVVATLSAIYYFIMLLVLYFLDSFGNTSEEQIKRVLSSVNWTGQFYQGMTNGILFFFILTLLVGAGAIANDNRANALLVYLSKPCRKIDYVLGKWFGIASIIFVVALVPMIAFYFYCAMSYREFGFLSKDPWLFFKLFPLAAIPAVVNASLIVGISSMFNQGRIAGAVYAGVYFLSSLAMLVVAGVRGFDRTTSSSLDNISYLSVSGLQDGLAKVLLNTDGGIPFLFGSRGGRAGRDMQQMIMPIPNSTFMISIVLIACGIGFWIAWRRVRAVEVVG